MLALSFAACIAGRAEGHITGRPIFQRLITSVNLNGLETPMIGASSASGGGGVFYFIVPNQFPAFTLKRLIQIVPR